MKHNQRALFSAILMSTMATTAWAQGRGGPCTLGYELSYGISAIDCLQCTVRSDGNEHWTEYGAEPVVRAMFRAMTPIQPGDVLVAVDGKLITTAAGGRALSHPVAGQVARFTVRRAGRQIDVSVLPGTPCPVVSAATAAAIAATASRADTMSQVTKDSFFQRFTEATARLRDTIELRYERDAFGRVYHITFQGDSANLSTLRSSRMQFESDGRAVLITDSAGRRAFYEANPRRGTGMQIGRFGFADQPVYTVTLPDGTIRTISNDGRDTTFTIPNGGKAGGVGAERDTLAGQRIGKIVVSNHGWLGFGLECHDCYSEIDSTRLRQWRFPTFPAVAAIEPNGPAATAGIRAGDVLHSIDGVSITTPAGATRFSVLKPGDRVRLTLDRNGRPIDIVLTVGPAAH